MGTKTTRKLLAVLMAIAMIMTSGIAVFAAGETSPGEGTKTPTIVNMGTNDSFLNKTFRFKWKGTNADYYKAGMRTKGGSWKTVNTGTTQYRDWKGLKTGQLYEFRAQAFTNDSPKGATSTYSYRWMQSVKASARGAKGKFTVKWNKVSGATTYQIQYSKSASMSSPKYAYAGSRATSKTISAAKGTWYYRIRPVKKSGNSYIGIYNGVQSVKVK